jgi:hypothetical protein
VVLWERRGVSVQFLILSSPCLLLSLHDASVRVFCGFSTCCGFFYRRLGPVAWSTAVYIRHTSSKDLLLWMVLADFTIN